MARDVAAQTLAAARLLVVEDDTQLRRVLKMALTDEGYVVAEAGNGAEALQVLEEGFQPHVILLDMRMPEMDGPEFAVAYRKRPGPHAPIMVITASVGLIETAIEVAPADVVRKPFDLVDLLDRVAAQLDSR